MAQTSIGFNGSISAVQWAQSAPALLSGAYGTGAVGECAVSQVAGSRAVLVASGRIGGDGVVTTLSAAEQVTLPTPTNGQWYLLVLNRKWSDGSTSLLIRNGPTTAAAVSGAAPSSYPASSTNTPGSNADVPIAWLWGTSSSTVVVIVPILRPTALVVPRRGTTAQRDALYGAPTALAPQIALQGLEWENTDLNVRERYTGTWDATYNAIGSDIPGWYGIDRAPTYVLSSGGSDLSLPSGVATNASLGLDEYRLGVAAVSNGLITIPKSGRWEVSVSGVFASSGTAGYRRIGVHVNNTNNTWGNGYILGDEDATANTSPLTLKASKVVTLNHGDTLNYLAQQGTGAALAFQRSASRTFISVRFLGPA